MSDSQPSDVFEYYRTMNTLNERASVESMLKGLANQFGATSVGVCSLADLSKPVLQYSSGGTPSRFPWQGDGKLLKAACASLEAEPCHDATGEWLVASVMAPQRDETFLAWLHRPEQNWSEAERWQWTFGSQALLRWYFQAAEKSEGVSATQTRLESAAAVSGRLIHEFGNFLTGIMGFTELARGRPASDSTLTMYLDEVMTSAKQGADWIHRLHRFCQRTRGQIWPAHLPSVLAGISENLQTQGVHQHVQIEAAAGLPLLEIDVSSLQAIFQELLNNAREAKKEKGSVTIRAGIKEMSDAECRATLGSLMPGTCVEITVSDDGPGFSADAQARLFRDPYFSSKPRHRGTGLLAIYGILQRFNGGLAFDFAPAKPGATIRVYLPATTLPPSPAPAAKPPLVLLVHSDAPLLESMRVVLASAGMRVTAVNASAAAMSTFQLAKPAFNLVIAETTMPKVSGFELARRILDHHSKAQFLFLSMQSAFHDLAEEELVNRFTVVRWPVGIDEFLKAVHKALTTTSA